MLSCAALGRTLLNLNQPAKLRAQYRDLFSSDAMNCSSQAYQSARQPPHEPAEKRIRAANLFSKCQWARSKHHN